jgi:hypothetical protein
MTADHFKFDRVDDLAARIRGARRAGMIPNKPGSGVNFGYARKPAGAGELRIT